MLIKAPNFHLCKSVGLLFLCFYILLGLYGIEWFRPEFLLCVFHTAIVTNRSSVTHAHVRNKIPFLRFPDFFPTVNFLVVSKCQNSSFCCLVQACQLEDCWALLRRLKAALSLQHPIFSRNFFPLFASYLTFSCTVLWLPLHTFPGFFSHHLRNHLLPCSGKGLSSLILSSCSQMYQGIPVQDSESCFERH